jgi:GtrA-like protein
MFAAVGTTGVAVHLVTLRLALTVFDFATAQALATIVAITSNFIINNVLTYRDRRLRGIKFFIGLMSFYAICGGGAVATVGSRQPATGGSRQSGKRRASTGSLTLSERAAPLGRMRADAPSKQPRVRYVICVLLRWLKWI